MKITTTLLLLLTAIISNAQFGPLPEKPRIFIIGTKADNATGSDKETDMFLNTLESLVLEKILHEFSCADVMSYSLLNEMCKFDRERVLLSNKESNLEDIAGAMNCDVLINLKVYKMGDDVYYGGTALGMRSGKVGSKHLEKIDAKKDFQESSKFADALVKDLLLMELCPYKGEITFKTTTTFNDKSERDGLPGQDCDFKATYEENNKTEQNWTFQKVKRYNGVASVSYTIDNYKKETERDNCHHCNKMENGYKLDVFEPERAEMKTSSVNTETYNANQIAPLDPNKTYEKHNSSIIIRFDTKANNYTITVKAATQPAKWTKKTSITNSGCPYDKDFENELSATYGQTCERTFGPFLGSPFQKNLKQNVSKTIVDPDSNGKSKTVENITFNLTR